LNGVDKTINTNVLNVSKLISEFCTIKKLKLINFIDSGNIARLPPIRIGVDEAVLFDCDAGHHCTQSVSGNIVLFDSHFVHNVL
jgi:hypothetical protein